MDWRVLFFWLLLTCGVSHRGAQATAVLFSSLQSSSQDDTAVDGRNVASAFPKPVGILQVHRRAQEQRSRRLSGHDSVKQSTDGVEHDVNEGDRILLPEPPVPPKPPQPESFGVDQQYEGIGIRDVKSLTGDYAVPPFPAGAASRTTLVATTIGSIEIRNKGDGVVLYRNSLFNFFQSSASINTTIFRPPYVIYDELENKFIVLNSFLQRRFLNSSLDSSYSTIHVAVSKTGSPVGPEDWYMQAINSTGYNSTQQEYIEASVNCKTNILFDVRFPGLKAETILPFSFARTIAVETSPEAIYVSAGWYGGTTGAFYGNVLYIIDKQKLYTDGKLSYSSHDPFQELSNPSSIPSDIRNGYYINEVNLIAPHVREGPIGNNIGTFLVAYDALSIGNTSYLLIETVKNPLSSPTFTGYIVELGEINQALDDVPLNAPQLGSVADLNTFSCSAFSAAWQDNVLWVTTQVVPFVGPNADQTTALWVKIKTDTIHNTFTLLDLGEIGGEDLGVGTFTFYASVAVNSQGVAAFGFGASGPLIHPGAYVVGRSPGDPKGTVSRSFVVKKGIDTFNLTYWLQYSDGIAVDPVDDSFWAYNEYAAKRDNLTNSTLYAGAWGTAWRRFFKHDPPSPHPGPP
jgi:hypothetical protein